MVWMSDGCHSGSIITIGVLAAEVKVRVYQYHAVPNKNLIQDDIGNKIKVGGDKDGKLQTDDLDVSGAEQPTGVGEVLGDDGGTVRGPRTDDNSSDVREPSGRVPGKGKKSGTSEDGGRRDNDTVSDRVPRQPVNYHITEADKIGSGGPATKARSNLYSRYAFHL